MKKGIIAVVIVLGLVGCQPKQDKLKEIGADSNIIEKTLDFSVVKTEVVNEISPTNKNSTYKYIKAKDNHIFVEIILKTENLTDKEMKLEDIYSGQLRINNQTYSMKHVIESAHYNQLSTTDTLKAKETRYIHVYSELPKDQLEEEASLNLKVLDNENYTYSFSTEKLVINNNIKSLKDILSLKKSEIVLKDIIKTKKLEPSVKGFVYSYIPTDNKDETFIALQIELKNTTEGKINPEEYIYCEYQVDKQIIKSQIFIENENNKSISNIEDIMGSSKRTLYLAIPVKDNLLKEEGTLTLYVEGQMFEIQD